MRAYIRASCVSLCVHASVAMRYEEVYGETRDVIECFSSLLSCFSRFLRPLQQNRTQSRLLYLFYNKESVKFPRALLSLFKINFNSKANNSVISMLYTLIKYATISQSESLL